MKINLKNLKESLLFTLGLLICTYIIYIRFILVRIPKPIPAEWNPWLFFLYFGLLLTYVSLLRHHINPPLYPSKLTKFLLTHVVKPLSSIFKDSLTVVHKRLVSENRMKARTLLHRIILHLGEFFQQNKLSAFTYVNTHVVLMILPRLITLFALAIDVILMHEFFYFYRGIFLLTIPIIWNVFLHFIKKQIQDQMGWYNCFIIAEVHPTQIICYPRGDTPETKKYQPTDDDYRQITHSVRLYLSTQLFLIDKLEPESIIFRTKRIHNLTTLMYVGYIVVWTHLVVIQLVNI
jgi:hypothetical protein